MNKIIHISLSAFLMSVMMLVVAACGPEETTDPYAAAESYVKEFDAKRAVSAEGADCLLQTESALFDEILPTLRKVTTDLGPEEISAEKERLASDKDFCYRWTLSERVWRVLALSQPDFTPEQAETFKTLISTRRIIDMLAEQIKLQASL